MKGYTFTTAKRWAHGVARKRTGGGMMFIDKKQGKFVTPLFWFCQCEEEFVHPASDRYCWACQTPQEDGKPAPVKWVLENKNALRRFAIVELVEGAILHIEEGLDGEMMELRYLAEAIPF